jgi:hypothetical protein
MSFYVFSSLGACTLAPEPALRDVGLPPQQTLARWRRLAAPLPDGGDQIELVLRVEAIEHLVERVPPESKVVHDGMFEIASSLVQ